MSRPPPLAIGWRWRHRLRPLPPVGRRRSSIRPTRSSAWPRSLCRIRPARAAVDHALAALLEAREALALRAASAGAAHASTTDIEARLLRSLAALDAALGELRTASGGPGPTTGFAG